MKNQIRSLKSSIKYLEGKLERGKFPFLHNGTTYFKGTAQLQLKEYKEQLEQLNQP